MNPANNPPLTAAGIASVVGLLLAAFTTLGPEQVAAVTAAVSLVAAFVASRFTSRYIAPELPDQADHIDPAAFHDGRDVL